MLDKIDDELKTFLIKVILPALVATSIKLSIQMQKQKLSIVSIITSFIIGIGSAYLASDVILTSFETKWVPLVISVITISGEKIGMWLVYKFNFDLLLSDFLQYAINLIKLKK